MWTTNYQLYADDKLSAQKLRSYLQSSSKRSTSERPDWLISDKLDSNSSRS